MNIIKIELKRNVRIRNTHNNILFPLQDIEIIYFKDGSKRIIDLFSEADITDVEYYEVEETSKTKTTILFINKREFE